MSLEVDQGNAKELFEACDLDASGYIDRNELAAVVDLEPDDLKEIFAQLDKDDDGKISIEDFTENFNKFKDLALLLDKDGEKDNSDLNDTNASDLEKPDVMNLRNDNQRTRPRQFTFDRGKKLDPELKKKAKMLNGQEYLEDVYDAILQSGNQRLVQALESFIESTADTLAQKNNENERLDAALRRATEKNSENARNLEEEMEQQILMLENKVREEERRKAEKAIQDAQLKIEDKNLEIAAIKEKLEENHAKELPKNNETDEELKERDMENDMLKSKLRESQTQLAVFRTEIANLKSEYDEQGERLSRERQTVLRCVHEQESLTRQLQLLHEANRKLHDTNDDLRAAIENKMRAEEDSGLSPNRQNMSLGSPMSAYKKNPYARRAGSFSSHSSRSGVTSPITKIDENGIMTSPTSRPLENEFNESSLMSELMAADEQGDRNGDVETEGILNTSMGLPEGFLPVHGIETDFVDTDVDTDPEFVENEEIKKAFRNMDNTRRNLDDSLQAKEKEQMMEQLRILCETNRRLSESNDELRGALGVLSNSVKKEKRRSSRNSSRRNSHSDYTSLPGSRSDSRCSSRTSKSSRLSRPHSTSSPRKEIKTHRKSSSSTTSSDADTDSQNSDNQNSENKISDNKNSKPCSCGKNITNDSGKCKACVKIKSEVDEDIVEPITVQIDESEAWNTDIFNEDECQCSAEEDKKCEFCTKLAAETTALAPAEKPCYKDACIQADVTNDLATMPEPETSLHVCEGVNCVCCDDEETIPLEKSIQVSEVLLDLTKEQLEQDSTTNNNKKANDNIVPDADEDVIIPDTEDNLRNEQDLFIDENCPDCNNPIDYSETLTGRCDCDQNRIHQPAKLKNDRVNNEMQKSEDPAPDTKSTLPDYSDATSNYTDRDTEVRTQVTASTSAENDSLANAARHRQGIGRPRQDESASDTTSGINSSYSVIQNIEDELTMYARQRESDEEIDEDDMTLDELQRIKELTSSGSDLDSEADVSDEGQPNGHIDSTDKNLNKSPLGEPERMYKVVLAGDAAVGKSSFILRLCKDRFFPALNSTLGVDFQLKTMDVDGHVIALQLWDTAGQERFRSIAKSYFRRVDGVLLLYDVTSESSFLDVREWIESIRESSNKPVPIMLCGNKVDLRSLAKSKGMNIITTEDGERLAKEIDAFFIETSARNNTNVSEAVLQLARKLHSQDNEDNNPAGMTLGENVEPKKKPGCCK